MNVMIAPQCCGKMTEFLLANNLTAAAATVPKALINQLNNHGP